MKEEFYRVLERVADLFVGNFAVSFQNELRFMVRLLALSPGARGEVRWRLKLMLVCASSTGQAEAAGSTCANAMKEQGVPMAQAAKHTAGALARL